MRSLVKLLLVSSVVVVVTVMSTGTALARTVIAGGIAAEGARITGTSQGQLTFRDSSGVTLECNVTLVGTIKRQTSGQLIILEPATNALVGRITEGRVANCSDAAAVVTLLFGVGLWQKYKVEKNAGELSEFYVLHAQVLIRRRVGFVTYECLIDTLVELQYNERTGVLRIVESQTLIRRALTFCNREEKFTGSIRVAPIVTLTLRDV